MNRGPQLRDRAGLAVLLCVVAVFLAVTYEATDVSSDFDGPKVLVCGLLFVFWLSGVVGWGWVAQRAVTGSSTLGSRELATALSLGSLLAAFAGYAFSVCGRRAFFVGSLAYCSSGLVAFVGAWPRRARMSGRVPRLLVGWLTLYALVRFVQVTRLSRHGDPFYYHLAAPVMWLRHASLAFDAAHPLNFQASLWEGLYLWPAQWFLGPDTVGLPAIQIFAQWTHVTLGWMGLGVTAIALLRSVRYPLVPSLIGGFAALASYSLWWTGGLAKNDCGAALWSLGAALLLLEGQAGQVKRRTDGQRRWLAAGLLLGAAFVAKYTVAFVLVPLVIAWLVVIVRPLGLRETLLAIAPVAVGVCLAASPFLLRNAVGTGAPLFPIGANPRDGTLSESVREYIGDLSPSGIDGGLRWRAERLAELLNEGTLVAAWVLAPLALVSVRGRRTEVGRRRQVLVATGLLSVCAFLLVARPGTDLRLLGPGIVLVTAGGALLGLLLLRALARRWFRRPPVPVGALVFLAVAATCRFAPEAIVDRYRGIPLQRAIAEHTGGDVKIFAATHIERGARIVTTGDNEIFYLLGHDVSVATEDVGLDRGWREWIQRNDTAVHVLAAFRARGFSYLLDTRFPGEAPPLAALLRPSLDAHPEWTVYDGREARLIDLRRVREE